LDGLKDLKNCGLKTKKVLRPFLDLKDIKILISDEAKFQFLILILDEAKLDLKAGNNQFFFRLPA